MHPLFNPEAYFHFLNVNFKLSAFYELLIRTATLSTFSLSIMFGMHFDNVSVLLKSVAAAYVHLATSSVTITCWYVHTAKLEIHTRLKWSVANWHYYKVDSTHYTMTYVNKEKTVINHSLRRFLTDVIFGLFRFYPLMWREI